MHIYKESGISFVAQTGLYIVNLIEIAFTKRKDEGTNPTLFNIVESSQGK